jgi:TM2 domain-containing membrane protein YozV
MKKLIVFSAFTAMTALCVPTSSKAAFPIAQQQTASTIAPAGNNEASTVQQSVQAQETPTPVPAPASSGKSQLVAALLAFFLGFLGIHRFYLGYTWQGIVQLLTLGGFGIWALIDFIRILIGDLQPKDGTYSDPL